MTRLACIASLLLFAAACDYTSDPIPPEPLSLDSELRRQLSNWGAIPIGAVPAQNAAMVDLGRSLFFDKILSGNRDVSCASCHDPLASVGDGLSLAVGTGGTGTGSSRTLGPGRRFVSRNAPTLINQGLGHFSLLWDGRLSDNGGFGFPAGPAPQPIGSGVINGFVLPPGLTNLVAAQAMLPVIDRVEMRGDRGDVDRFGNPNELAEIADAEHTAIWNGVMRRLLAIQEYAAKFSAAFPGVPTNALGFQHAANAMAAFQIQALTRTNSPFDRYLARDDRALNDEEKRGALLFFGRARCSSCHSGALLGSQQFANIGVPQLGPGRGSAAPLDKGRGEQFPQQSFYQFAFRVPALRNVELTAPYMHNGAYRTLEQVVRHYTNADSAQRSYDPSILDPALRATYHGDNATKSAVLANLDGRLRGGIQLTEGERRQIVAFLKSLTDPAARDLSGITPAAVPSGLPVRQ